MPKNDKKPKARRPKKSDMLTALNRGASTAKPATRGDPPSILADVNFGTASSVTVSVSVPVSTQRTNYALYVAQPDVNDSTAGMVWTLVASSSGQPTGNQLGSSSNVTYIAQRRFFVLLNYFQVETRAFSCVIEADQVAQGSVQNDLPMN
jgi:hypothetical protein